MVELHPAFNSQMGDKVLRSIEDFIVEQAHAAKHTVQTAGTDNCDSERGTPLSPNAASPEPSVEPSISSSPEHSIDQSQQAKSSPASNEFLIRSVVRTLVGGLFLVIVVAVAWQTYQDDQTRTLIKALAHSSVSWLSSSLKATQQAARWQGRRSDNKLLQSFRSSRWLFWYGKTDAVGFYPLS